MCGRYALGVRLAYIRQRLQERGMQVDEAPDDDEVRETYNFAPGNFGAVYRADVPEKHHSGPGEAADVEQGSERIESNDENDKTMEQVVNKTNPRFKIQSMKWGLIPFWTKRQPDYGSMMRTINCRDDSLIEDRGMWTTMKRRKRCIVVCQGFYEWLKKGPGGKERIPHFVRRKDGDLMCFAGLWDCVSYEGSEDKLYTYTVITTSSNSYLNFLHDRMPVILDPGTEAISKWLDPNRTTWSDDLQSILKPYDGELECYPVSKEVGKVGNNSPDFIVPVNSKENKNNIANFFANAKKKDDVSLKEPASQEEPVTNGEEKESTTQGVKREHTPDTPSHMGESKKAKSQQTSRSPSPQKSKMRSATQNVPRKKTSEVKPTDGSQRITNFFRK
ncbi:uncharacterized protein N7477_009945 [Penicillium maclennaniae]|uniref:uncharacterized protein n=1 Tax=Penicillium maclennaniae TaxID=1343394 RepID=UPI002540170E|nr:uncharacterized protein N7477_009945 [Penicillium maclennaniae]KAJ5662329.1 hypothetical protein N7477_009945 [Penicillium maclennaniae]